MKTGSLMTAALLLLAAAAPPPRSVLDLKTAPGDAGRQTYAQMAISTFASVIAEAPICNVRSHDWANHLEFYVMDKLEGPRPGIAEGNADPADYARWLGEMRALEGRADLKVAADPGGTCARLRRNPNLALGDWFEARMQRQEHSKNPWGGAGGH